MQTRLLAVASSLAALLTGPATGQDDPEAPTPPPTPAVATITVDAEPLNPVSPLLFGQFLEIASWGERGPEAFVDPETRELPGPIVEKLAELNAGVIRFPGGTDVDFLDWTTRIPNAPGRADADTPATIQAPRGELTTRFTYDRFLALCERLSAEPLLVVPAVLAVLGDRPVEESAAEAADQVAYMNARPDQPGLSGRHRAFAEARAVNGRERPWSVKHWQVGNELFIALKDGFWKVDPAERARRIEHTAATLAATAEAMRAVDPAIRLIVDADLGDRAASLAVLRDPRVRRLYDTVTAHAYGPWKLDTPVVRGEEVSTDELDPATLFHALVTFPAQLGWGRSLGLDDWVLQAADEGGYFVACTEWNWNGWGPFDEAHPHLAASARAIGAASFLQQLMREGNRVRLATQSAMLTESWNIGSVQADPTDPSGAFVSPTGAATAFYAARHGDRRLGVEVRDAPPPAALDAMRPAGRRPLSTQIEPLDATATRTAGTLYVHVVHRGLDDPLPVRIEFAAGLRRDPNAPARLHTLAADPSIDNASASVRPASGTLASGGGDTLELTLDPRTVNTIEVPLAPAAP